MDIGAADPVPQVLKVMCVRVGLILLDLIHAATTVFAFLQQHVVMPPSSSLNFIITLFLAFTGIKSQGQPDFPFITHPLLVRFSINSIVVYGLCCAAELVTSEAQGNKNLKDDITTTTMAITSTHTAESILLQNL